MLGRFDGEDLRSLSVWPNAQALYHRATAEGLLGGAEQVSADSLAFRFRAGELRQISGYGGIQGTSYGPSQVPQARLPGFAFAPGGAPTRGDLLEPDGWEARWLRAEGPPPEGLAPPAPLPAAEAPPDVSPPGSD